MANIKQAVDFVLHQEDGTLSGVITNIPGDAGGTTRFGLCQKWHPELVASKFFSTMPGWCALSVAEETYAKQYGPALCLSEIESQAIATALLSFAVNEGQRLAVILLQRAAGAVPDGVMGPETVAAVNRQDERMLLDAYCGAQSMHYAALAKAIPVNAKFLHGWLNRAEQVEMQA